MSESTATPEVAQRTPILNKETATVFPLDDIDRQWGLATEAIRRDMVGKPEVRKTLVPFCREPVSEALPGQFLSTLSSVDERVARLAQRYQETLPGYLDLPTVPDEQIKPDVRHAARLHTLDDTVAMLTRLYGQDDPMYKDSLQRHIDSGTFMRGITAEERLMIVKRYKYARDAKILALGAEVMEQGTAVPNQNGEITLPSGVKIGMDVTEAEQRNDLLNPHLWEKRRQIKDRVYEISVGGRNYILKEKKTPRHTDTKKGGHREGRTSADEFAVAKHFREHGRLNQGNIGVDWERPIGFVTYPDGFQFSVFEYEEGLLNDDVQTRLAIEITNHREQFEEEYKLIAGLAQKYKDSPEVLAFEDQRTESGLKAAMKWLGIQKESPLQLTFEEFAMVKGLRMQRQSRELMEHAMLNNEYENSDMDGYAYRVHSNGGVRLDIVGFDFEYFEKVSPERAAEVRERRKELQREWESRQGIGFLGWNNGQRVTRMQKAAYFAMLEAEGLLQKELE